MGVIITSVRPCPLTPFCPVIRSETYMYIRTPYMYARNCQLIPYSKRFYYVLAHNFTKRERRQTQKVYQRKKIYIKLENNEHDYISK